MPDIQSSNDCNSIMVSWDKDIFRSKDNSFCVGLFKNKNEDAEKNTIMCKGSNLPSISNVTFIFTGSWVYDKKYGKQFNVVRYEEKIGDNKQEIISYLSSGLFKGIGRKTAERIWEAFGKDSIKIIAENTERLMSVKGISKAQVEKIQKSYEESHIPEELTGLLLGRGFNSSNIAKIYGKFKQESYKKITENPYELCNISGISFRLADNLRSELYINVDDHRRLFAAEIEAIKNNFFCGKVGITLKELITKTAELTGVRDFEVIKADIMSNLRTGDLTYKKMRCDGIIKQYLYTHQIKQAEDKLAKLVVKKLMFRKDDSKKALDYLSTNTLEINLDDSQKGAVLNAFSSAISIITGGPGTGKTTTIKAIAEVDKAINNGKEPVFLGPTGRAARRITESSGYDAMTIHSKLGLMAHDDDRVQLYKKDEDDEIIKDTTIIIDEFSMVDMMLALALFDRTENCRFIIVGDPNQLPSVGAGNVLKDLIDSEAIPVCRLKYVHRQDECSTINENANGMQMGMKAFLQGEDFHISYSSEMKEIEDMIVDTYKMEYTENPNMSIAVLCPYRNYDAGMYSVNNRVQEMLNPVGDEFKGLNNQVFRIDDPVMHVKRNTEDAVNGDVGIVKKIGVNTDGEKSITVEYDNGKKKFCKEYTQKDIDQLSLAYAMTIHKSQGSEYDTVITLLTQNHKSFVVRNIPYTAITRAKKKVYFFTDNNETITKAIENNSMEERNTLLAYLIKDECEKRSMFKLTPLKKNEMILDKNEIKGQITLNFSA